MSQYVLDCSVVMPWLYRDEANPATDLLYSTLQAGRDQAFVPPLFFTELLNALLMGERRRRCQSDEADRFFGSVLALPIVCEDPPDMAVLRRVRGLARGHKLTSYDATYLEAAQRRGLPLAILDDPLREAATKIGVPLAIQIRRTPRND